MILEDFVSFKFHQTLFEIPLVKKKTKNSTIFMFHHYKYIISQKYEKIIKSTFSFKALYSSDTGNKSLI